MSGVTLLTSWEERREELTGGMYAVRISSGEPHTRAIFAAVIDRYGEVTKRPRPTVEELEQFIDAKVTLVQHGENFIGGGVLAAEEGRLFKTSSGVLGILPKGKRSKGLRVKPDNVLDLIPGWAADEAAKLVGQVREHMPTLRPLTQERLLELPSNSDTISLCVFGEHHLPDSRQADALWLIRNYLRGDDIVEGVLLCRPEHGVSENGSIWGRQLLGSNVGEVGGFSPITFAEAIELCDADFDEAYAQIMGALASPGETCPECGQPDNCGDCTHERVVA